MDERARIQSMLNSLTAFQQEQIRNQVSTYRATLAAQRLPEDKVALAVYEFWKTMVTYICSNTAGRAHLSKAPPGPPSSMRPVAFTHHITGSSHLRPPPPPPPSKPHPLAMSRPMASAQSSIKFVDKSNGFLSNILGQVSMPVGLQDWVNRVYLSGVNLNKSYVDYYIEKIIRPVLTQLSKVDWVGLPTPSPMQIGRSQKDKPIDLDSPPSKKTRIIPPAPQAEFIPFTKSKAFTLSGPTKKQNQVELKKRAERAQKFKDHLMEFDDTSAPLQSVNVVYEFGNDEDDVFEKTGEYAVVGTCKTMEKRYFRLTSAPDPTLVRPEPVLAKWLIELESIWAAKSRDWKYIEDQMKAIRQDLTVQNLRGELTTRVYELNARWALESGDLGQFNQCQTQLKNLHEQCVSSSAYEFISYRLLYYYYQNLRVDEQIFLKHIYANPDICNHPNVQFALQVRTAATTNNFSEYFRLARLAPTCSASHIQFLMRAFEERQRVFAVLVLTKAFITQIRIDWLANIIGLDFESCSKFLHAHGAVFKNNEALDPKASHAIFADDPLLMSSKLKLMG